MNRLFVALVAVVFCLTVPSLASAGDGSTPGDPVGGAPYCGPDVECSPPTEICEIGTEENPVPAQEYCIWPDDPNWESPDYCAGYPEWQEEPGGKDDEGVEEGVEPGYPGDDYSEEEGPGYEDEGEGTDPGYGVDGPDCVYYMTPGGPETRRDTRAYKADRSKAVRRAARRRAVRAKRARVQARRAAARRHARARAARRG
jgi:hypothetical protein